MIRGDEDFGMQEPFIVYSVKTFGENSKHKWIGSDNFLRLKEAKITEEDDDEALSIPFECSLPNMDL